MLLALGVLGAQASGEEEQLHPISSCAEQLPGWLEEFPAHNWERSPLIRQPCPGLKLARISPSGQQPGHLFRTKHRAGPGWRQKLQGSCSSRACGEASACGEAQQALRAQLGSRSSGDVLFNSLLPRGSHPRPLPLSFQRLSSRQPQKRGRLPGSL